MVATGRGASCSSFSRCRPAAAELPGGPRTRRRVSPSRRPTRRRSLLAIGKDTLKTRRTLTVDGKQYDYFSLAAAAERLGDLTRLPVSLKVLLENLLRYEDGRSVRVEDIDAMGAWLAQRRSDQEIAYRPARVLMQDFTGVPAVVDLAAMREAMEQLG